MIWKRGLDELALALKAIWSTEDAAAELCLALATFCLQFTQNRAPIQNFKHFSAMQEGICEEEDSNGNCVGLVMEAVDLSKFSDYVLSTHPHLVALKAQLFTSAWLHKQVQAQYFQVDENRRSPTVLLRLDAVEAQYVRLMGAGGEDAGENSNLVQDFPTFDFQPCTAEVLEGPAPPSPPRPLGNASMSTEQLLQQAQLLHQVPGNVYSAQPQGTGSSIDNTVPAPPAPVHVAAAYAAAPPQVKPQPLKQPRAKPCATAIAHAVHVQNQASRNGTAQGYTGKASGTCAGNKPPGIAAGRQQLVGGNTAVIQVANYRGGKGAKGSRPGPPAQAPQGTGFFAPRSVQTMREGGQAVDLQYPMTDAECSQATQHLQQAGSREGVGIMCLGRLGRGTAASGCIAYVLIATAYPGGTVYVFDLRPFPQTAGLSARAAAVGGLLRNPSVSKYFHDCRKEVEALFYRHQMPVVNYVDVKVCHDYLLQAKYQAGIGPHLSECGLPNLAALLEEYQVSWALPPSDAAPPPKDQVSAPRDSVLDWHGASSQVVRSWWPLLGLMTASLITVHQLITTDWKTFPDKAALSTISRAWGEWFFDAKDRGLTSWEGVRGPRVASATSMPDTDLEMLPAPLVPNMTLKEQLAVLKDPKFVRYMGTYGLQDEELGFGRTGLPEPDDTQEVAVLLRRLPPKLQQLCLRKLKASQQLREAVRDGQLDADDPDRPGGTADDTSATNGAVQDEFAWVGAPSGAAGIVQGFTDAAAAHSLHEQGDMLAGEVHSSDTTFPMASATLDGGAASNDAFAANGHDWEEQQQQQEEEEEEEQEEEELRVERDGSKSRKLTEIVIDDDRPAAMRYSDGTEEYSQVKGKVQEALQYLSTKAEPFQLDDRMGIKRTLHRISAIRDRDRSIIGLTYRIGRHMPGVCELIIDLLADIASGRSKSSPSSASSWQDDDTPFQPSLLIVGPPGVGKTTLLRDVAYCFANRVMVRKGGQLVRLCDRFQKRTIVVDTSNEIGGDGSVPHACIGNARRMPIPSGQQQHEILLRAVQNHNPQVLVVDEIGTKQEVQAVRSIAQRGVIMVGTAHGSTLGSLLRNPDVAPLVGGVHEVTVGDARAQQSADAKKTRLERKGAPTFSVLIEIRGYNQWAIHTDVANSVDVMLNTERNDRPKVQLRRWEHGKRVVCFQGGHSSQGAGVHRAPGLQTSYVQDLFLACRGYAEAHQAQGSAT